MDDAPPNLIALRDARQRAEALVAQRYGEDLIDADQLDRRMERIADAQTLAQLEQAIADLVDPGTTPAMALTRPTGPGSSVLRASVALARPDQVPDERRLTCVFAELNGIGPGPLAQRTKLTCVFGSAKLDLRESEFGPGATLIDVQVMFGEVEILVPQGLAVIVDVSLLLASVDRRGVIPASPRTADEPHLRILGSVFAGSIELDERTLGESAREARRRRRRERKLAKAERKALSRGR